MSFIYDLYIMYIYWTEFNENIFNEEFLLKNNELINKHIDDWYIWQIQNWVDEFNIKEIVNLNLNNISRNDKKEFLLLEQVSDLLWLLDTWFKSNFEISSSLLYYDWPINGEVLPAYVIPIIYEIFWDKKSIKITKNNYEEIKNKFKSARVNYLTSLGIKDFSDKKEIKEKINIKTEQLWRINTYRIRNPENPDSKNKNIQEFQRKISLLWKTIKKNDK